jgi:hypothetical protein
MAPAIALGHEILTRHCASEHSSVGGYALFGMSTIPVDRHTDERRVHCKANQDK